MSVSCARTGAVLAVRTQPAGRNDLVFVARAPFNICKDCVRNLMAMRDRHSVSFTIHALATSVPWTPCPHHSDAPPLESSNPNVCAWNQEEEEGEEEDSSSSS